MEYVTRNKDMYNYLKYMKDISFGELFSELAMNIKRYFISYNKYLHPRAVHASYCVGIALNPKQ